VPERATRRPAGTGGLFLRRDRTGREVWYAKWREGERQVKRTLGPRRQPGSKAGLSRGEAEAALRKILGEVAARPPVRELLEVGEAGERYVLHVEHFRGRKRSTVQDYEIVVRKHLAPFFAGRSLDRVDRRQIEAYQRAKLAAGLKPKTVANHVRLLHGIFRYAVGQEWAGRNPVAGIEHPGDRDGDRDIRYLTVPELEALIAAVPDDRLGPTDRVLYIVAAMTGMRRGELQAVRWMEVDFDAGVVRVRRSYGRGEFTTPKSRRSLRAVPLAERPADALRAHRARSAFASEDDLVFAHPLTGRVYDDSKILKRFKAALSRAGLRDARFHDLRHTFGTRMAAAGAPLRFIQEWMGHGDYKTTSIYADYAPDPSQGAQYAAAAFASSANDSKGANDAEP
jgi:integrase